MELQKLRGLGMRFEGEGEGRGAYGFLNFHLIFFYTLAIAAVRIVNRIIAEPRFSIIAACLVFISLSAMPDPDYLWKSYHELLED